MNNCFRSIMCLKNRYGESEVEIACQFLGKINVWKDLPKPEEIYDFEKYTNSDWILGKEINREVVEDKSDNISNKFIL